LLNISFGAGAVGAGWGTFRIGERAASFFGSGFAKMMDLNPQNTVENYCLFPIVYHALA
jgi:hypothetical protein